MIVGAARHHAVVDCLQAPELYCFSIKANFSANTTHVGSRTSCRNKRTPVERGVHRARRVIGYLETDYMVLQSPV